MTDQDPDEDALFDAYLDAALRGELQEPSAFCRERGAASVELSGLLEGVYGLLREETGDRVASAGSAAALPAEEGLPFERLGEFRLVRRLGEGGMGVVYLAEQTSLGRLVAVKVIRPELAASPTAIARLQREAEAIAKLRHPHVVGIHAVGEADGVRYFAMELVPGRSLAEIYAEAAQGNPLPIPTHVRWAREVAEALMHAHAHGVVHRDVKPSNVRITTGGQAKLLDFGLAFDAEAARATLTRDFAGSPAYASPEQISGERGRVDYRTDVYSLGATLYEGLAGQAPHAAASLPQLMRNILTEEPTRLRLANPAIPRDLEIVVAKALEKDPDARYDTAQALASDLGAVLELRAIMARPPKLAARVSRWIRGHRTTAAALAAAALVLLAGALFVGARGAMRRRADGRAARELVVEAVQLLEHHEQLRAARDKASFRVATLQVECEQRPLSAEEERELWLNQDTVSDYGSSRDRAFVDVLDRLTQAALLDPRSPGLPEARAFYFYQRYLVVRSHEDLVTDGLWLERIRESDPDGIWSDKTAGSVQVTLTTEPHGAEVYLFRYLELSRLRAGAPPRWVPAAALGQEAAVQPGTLVLEVVRGVGGLRSGDLLLSLEGQPINDARADRQRAQRGGLNANAWTEGALREQHIPAGLRVRATAAPLILAPERRLGSSPVEGLELEPGCYVALLRKRGYEDQRFSFHVDHVVQAWGKDQKLHARLNRRERTPAGFVFVGSNPERGFWIQEREVTCGEYLAFLRAEARLHEGGTFPAELLPHHPLATELGGRGVPWPRTDGRFELPLDAHEDLPVLGVSYDAARAYVRWRERIDTPRLGGRAYGLPTHSQWRRAAFGGDWRDYVFGDLFLPRWVSSRFGQATTGPSPVLSHPIDESPVGVFDMAGSAREWLRDEPVGHEPWMRLVAGGSWATGDAQSFRSDHVQSFSRDEAQPTFGFRLVLEQVE